MSRLYLGNPAWYLPYPVQIDLHDGTNTISLYFKDGFIAVFFVFYVLIIFFLYRSEFGSTKQCLLVERVVKFMQNIMHLNIISYLYFLMEESHQAQAEASRRVWGHQPTQIFQNFCFYTNSSIYVDTLSRPYPPIYHPIEIKVYFL